MSRALCAAALLVLAASSARGFDEPAVANRNLAAIMAQLERGNWNERIHAVHELDYMRDEGLPGLAFATEDGDWQVRMTAVHSLSSLGSDRAPILNRLLRHETCPVVRLMTLHSLGSLGPEGEEAKAMGWISDASTKDVNACRDQPGPGRASWARGKGGASGAPNAAAAPAPAVRRAAPVPETGVLAAAPEPEPDDDPEDDVVTRDPILPAPPAPASAKKRGVPEDLPAPSKFERHTELDALLDSKGPAATPRRGVELAMRSLSTAAPETLPRPVGRALRDHTVIAPGIIMKDAGGKAPFDALPGLLRALKKGDARTRARAADDLGHLGADAAPAVPALMDALRDRGARVRASAGLALGNIGTAHRSVVPLLTKALKDRSEDVRYAAALALSRIDTAEARDAFNRHVGKEARLAIDRPKRRK